MAFRAREKLKDKREKYLGEKKAEIAILIDSEKLVRAFPNISNQIRYQKKRLQNLNPGMNLNPMMPNMPSANSFTNLNTMDPYSGMGPTNPNKGLNMNIHMNPIPPASTSSYQT